MWGRGGKGGGVGRGWEGGGEMCVCGRGGGGWRGGEGFAHGVTRTCLSRRVHRAAS